MEFSNDYGLQETFDSLYQKSLQEEEFTDLISIIVSEENIKTAYRNLKKEYSLNYSDIEAKKFREIGKLTPDEIVREIKERILSKYGYHPVAIQSMNDSKKGKKSSLFRIYSVWDRLIQQCIKQVLEPVCEAKFSEKSYGFRPDRSQQNALAVAYRNLQQLHMYYVVELDLKDFFDLVDHTKLKRALWAMNIHDKTLIYLINQILKTPVRLSDGTTISIDQGIPHGAALSCLFSNIYFNEFDHWLDAHWEEHPIVKENSEWQTNGLIHRGRAYKKMRKLGYGATCFSISFLMVTPENEMRQLQPPGLQSN